MHARWAYCCKVQILIQTGTNVIFFTTAKNLQNREHKPSKTQKKVIILQLTTTICTYSNVGENTAFNNLNCENQATLSFVVAEISLLL